MARPDFEAAETFWGELISARHLSQNIKWVFRENLCLGRQENTEEFRLYFETEINPVTAEDVRLVYDQACKYNFPIVFEALVSDPQYLLCTLLGDPYLADDDVYMPEWDMYFQANSPYKFYEVVVIDSEWQSCKSAELRTPSGLDFVYSLEKIRSLGNTGDDGQRRKNWPPAFSV